MGIYRIAQIGTATNMADKVVAPMGQSKVFRHGDLIAISGNKPLSVGSPGDGTKSATQNGNEVEKSRTMVFINGNAVAHHTSEISDSPAHKIDYPGEPPSNGVYTAGD